MELTLTINDGVAIGSALNDAIVTAQSLTSSTLDDISASADSITLSLDCEGSDISTAALEVINAFSGVGSSSIAALSTDNDSDGEDDDSAE